MKRVLFAFIFAILGLGVGTVFSKTVSKSVDYISGFVVKIGKSTQKALLTKKEKKPAAATTVENPFDNIDAGIKAPEPAPLEAPKPAEIPAAEEPKIENPFAASAPAASAEEPAITQEEADFINEQNQRVGVEIQTGLDVFEDENGFYVEDPTIGEVYEVFEDEIEFD